MGFSHSKEEQLIDAALKLFNEFGFHGTPTAKISKEAGVSTGTLYNYFESKVDLINKLYIRVKKHSTDFVINSFVDSSNTKIAIKSIWISFVKWGVKYPDLFKFKEIYCQSPFIETLSKEMNKDDMEPIVGVVKNAIKDGIIKREDFSLIFAMFSGTTNSTIKHIINSQVENVDEIIERSFTLFWDGLAR